jgi:putative transposase
MKKSRFTEAQILAILKQGEGGVPVADLCREHGISNATFYIYGRLSRRKRFEICFDLVIIPFLSGRFSGLHAASFSFMAGVIPPMPMFGRSLL